MNIFLGDFDKIIKGIVIHVHSSVNEILFLFFETMKLVVGNCVIFTFNFFATRESDCLKNTKPYTKIFGSFLFERLPGCLFNSTYEPLPVIPSKHINTLNRYLSTSHNSFSRYRYKIGLNINNLPKVCNLIYCLLFNFSYKFINRFIFGSILLPVFCHM